MQALADRRNPVSSRLAGAFLYALLLTAVALPLAVWIAGLVIGPPELRAQIVVTTSRFGAAHGSLGLYAVFIATVGVLTLFNLLMGPRKRYAFDWNLGPRLMDDALGPREKVALVLRSGWGRALLVLLVFWLVLAAFP